MLGNFKVRVRDGTEQTISPINIIRYWNYSNSNPQDDIMLIKLAYPAQLNAKVQPISIATTNPKPGTMCVLSGLDWSQSNNGEYIFHGQYDSVVIPEACVHVYTGERAMAKGRYYFSGLMKEFLLRR